MMWWGYCLPAVPMGPVSERQRHGVLRRGLVKSPSRGDSDKGLRAASVPTHWRYVRKQHQEILRHTLAQPTGSNAKLHGRITVVHLLRRSQVHQDVRMCQSRLSGPWCLPDAVQARVSRPAVRNLRREALRAAGQLRGVLKSAVCGGILVCPKCCDRTSVPAVLVQVP